MQLRQLAFVTLWSAGSVINAHVQFVFPPSRIDSDYQYTFDGTCYDTSCDSFCGESTVAPPVTTVNPGNLTLTVKVSVGHEPYKYRVSFTSSGVDGGYDTYILRDDILNPNPGFEPTILNVTVSIPDVVCDPTCSLHLFDYYYFVSCSNIIVKDGNSTETSSNETISASNNSGNNNLPVLSQKDQGYAISLFTEMVLPMRAWFALGLSYDGKMEGSRAIIGNIDGVATTASEYDLTSNGISVVATSNQTNDAAAQNFHVAVSTVTGGMYSHYMNVSFPKTHDVLGDICGYSILWAHGDSTSLGYHSENRGVLGTVDCEQQPQNITKSTVAPATTLGTQNSTKNEDLKTCNDHPAGWYDSNSSNCEAYGETGCPDGNIFRNFGYSAQEACCICGGGNMSSSMLIFHGNSTNQTVHPPKSYDSTGTNFTGVATELTGPVLNQTYEGNTIRIIAEVTLPTKSWFAVGLSPNGRMIGSRAVFGSVSSTSEYDLNGKFKERVILVHDDNDLAAIDSSFETMQVHGGYFVHRLTITFPTNTARPNSSTLGDDSICGMQLIWAHADLKFPSTDLGYHGNSRGFFGQVEC